MPDYQLKYTGEEVDEGIKKALKLPPDGAPLQPKNELDNSYFINPVNQRGQTVYNETDSFTIDRWKLDGYGAISILASGVEIKPITYASLAQIVVNSDSLIGKHMTFAAKTAEYGTVVLNFIFGQGLNISDSTGSMQLIHWFDNILFIRAVEGTPKLTVEWAALYEGSYTAETLPPYVPKGYGAELMECMRYLHRFRSAEMLKTYCDDFCPPMRQTPNGVVSTFEATIDGAKYYFANAEL